MKLSAFGTIGFLILSLALFACTPAPTAPLVVAATPSITFTAMGTPIETPTLPPLPTVAPETVAPTPVPTALVLDVPADGTNFQLSPDEQWLTYLVVSPVARTGAQPVRFGPGAGPHPTTLHLMNVATTETHQVTTDCTNFLCEFAWLSTGQFLWREVGNLYLANPNGQNQRNLIAPDVIIEILGVTPNDTFDAIPEPQRNRDPIPEFVIQNDLLYFTEDNTVAGLAYDITDRTFEGDIQILAIPLQAGAIPTLLAAVPRLYYGGRSGPPPPPSVLLADSFYWVTTESAVLQDGDGTFTTFVVDVESQRVESITSIMGIDTEAVSRGGNTITGPNVDSNLFTTWSYQSTFHDP